jgi:hypothetical protein
MKRNDAEITDSFKPLFGTGSPSPRGVYALSTGRIEGDEFNRPAKLAGRML